MRASRDTRSGRGPPKALLAARTIEQDPAEVYIPVQLISDASMTSARMVPWPASPSMSPRAVSRGPDFLHHPATTIRLITQPRDHTVCRRRCTPHHIDLVIIFQMVGLVDANALIRIRGYPFFCRGLQMLLSLSQSIVAACREIAPFSKRSCTMLQEPPRDSHW